MTTTSKRLALTTKRKGFLSRKEQHAVAEFHALVKDAVGSNLQMIRLFGSKARGDATRWSDIDLLVRVKHHSWQLEDRIIDLASDVGLKYDVYISPRVIGEATFKHPVWRITPFLQAIQREGIPV